MTPKKFILLPVEIKVRDFVSRLKLSIELCKRGFNIIIGSQDALRSNLPNLPKGVYFEKAISKEKVKFFEQLKSDGYLLVSLDEEGLCSLFNYERYITQRVCDETLLLADKVFTWGDSEANLINERYPSYKRKIKVTGNPRIDMLCKDNRNFHQYSAGQYREKLGPYFLFPSSFTVNHAMGNKNLDKFLIKMGRVKTQDDLKSYHDKQEFFRKTFFEYSDLVEIVAKKFTHINLVVRPHPSEDASHWLNLSKKYENVFVESKGDVSSWILGSEAVIHSSCTTGMEAFLLDIPVLSFLPFTDHEYSKQISNSVSKVSKDSEGILSSLEYLLENKSLSNYSKEDCRNFLKHHLANLDEVRSWDLIGEELESLKIPRDNLKTVTMPLVKSIIRKFIYLRQRMFNPMSLVYESQKFNGISFEEINENIKGLSEPSTDGKKVKVNYVSKDLFHLYIK